MRLLLRRGLMIAMLAAVSPAVPAVMQAQQPPEQQGEFQPVDPSAQRERMPAAPLLISAYAFALVALFTYLVSVSRRLTAVKTDIQRLEADLKRSGRG